MIDGKPEKIRKQRLCWLLQDDSIKVSNDIGKRYIPSYSVALKEPQKSLHCDVWNSNEICRGDIIMCKDNGIYVGMVTGFRKSTDESKKQRTIYRDFIDLNKDNNISVFLDPLFKIINLRTKKELVSDRYFSSNSYKCHFKHLNIDVKNPNVIRFALSE